MVLVFWKTYLTGNKLSDDLVNAFTLSLKRNGFIQTSTTNQLKFVKPNGFRIGPPPIFHIVQGAQSKIYSRPHLGAILPFSILILYMAYSIILSPLFNPESEFHIAGLFFLIFTVTAFNAVIYFLFHSDKKEFEDIYNKIFGDISA